MFTTTNAKGLLEEDNNRKLKNFLLNDKENLSLPPISHVPWFSGGAGADAYTKIKIPPAEKSRAHICYIVKNGELDSIVWKTEAENYKRAIRWGIIQADSITGKAIYELGQYRVTDCERLYAKLVSNTRNTKLATLDLYQDRIEALEKIESLVNTNASLEEYRAIFSDYIDEISTISDELEQRLAHTDFQEIVPYAVQEIKEKISSNIQNARSFVDSLTDASLKATNNARGPDSILTFLKEQIIDITYEMQAINQNLSFSKERPFAATRGSLDEYIENARNVVTHYQPDLRNAVTEKHHGLYHTTDNNLIAHRFSEESPENQQKKVTAISFFEKWDRINYDNPDAPRLENDSGDTPLTVIEATHWKKHHTFTAFFKKIIYSLFNMIKLLFVATHPWENDDSTENGFQLIAKQLRQHTKLNKPLWVKVFHFFEFIISSIKDCFNGISNFGIQLFINMPSTISNDWNASKQLPSINEVLNAAEEEIAQIKLIENERLNRVLSHYPFTQETSLTQENSEFAQPDYALTPGEQDDPLTVLVDKLNGFCDIFADMFAKNPIGGLLYTTAYTLGGAAVFFPDTTAQYLGADFVNKFNQFAYSMSSAQAGAAVSGCAALGHATFMACDLLTQGSNSMVFNAMDQIVQDPFTIASYVFGAYGLGYILANGINGYDIPWLSDELRQDVGTNPHVAYPFFGAKICASAEVLLTRDAHNYNHKVSMTFNGRQLNDQEQLRDDLVKTEQINKIIDRFHFVHWLSTHGDSLPKLSPDILLNISKYIDLLFPKKSEAQSLKKMLYPADPPSVIFQLFAIPSNYIPGVLRLLLSVGLTVCAWINGNPYPEEPIKRAWKSLFNKIKKDLSRIVICTAKIIQLLLTPIASILKMSSYTLNMLVSRIGEYFDWHPALTMHGWFATVHNLFNKIGEYLYPVKAIKSVVFADQAHTVKQSYVELLKVFSPNSSDCDSGSTSPKSNQTQLTDESLIAEMDEDSVYYNDSFVEDELACSTAIHPVMHLNPGYLS